MSGPKLDSQGIQGILRQNQVKLKKRLLSLSLSLDSLLLDHLTLGQTLLLDQTVANVIFDVLEYDMYVIYLILGWEGYR